MNDTVHIFRYVTAGTFDAYLYQLVEKKQKFISQIMTSKTPMRTMKDVDAVALSYGEIKGIASGNPKIKEKTELDAKIANLKLLKQNFLDNKWTLENNLARFYPNAIRIRKDKIEKVKLDIKEYEDNKAKYGDEYFSMTIMDKKYDNKEEAGKALLERLKTVMKDEYVPIGEYRGFTLEATFKSGLYNCHEVAISKNYTYETKMGADALGNLTRIENVFKGLYAELAGYEKDLDIMEQQYKNAEIESKAEFPYENELNEKIIQLKEINAELGINENEENVIDFDDSEEIEDKAPKKEYVR